MSDMTSQNKVEIEFLTNYTHHKPDGALVIQAIQFAQDAHGDQKRKWSNDQEPYFYHPVRVANLMLRHGLTETNGLIMALLHDVIEDTPWTREDIRKKFGEEVASGVDALTDEFVQYRNTEGWSRWKRKEGYFGRVGIESLLVRQIKLLDRIDNLSDWKAFPSGFIHKYVNETDLLLECLKGTDKQMEGELIDIVYEIRYWLTRWAATDS